VTDFRLFSALGQLQSTTRKILDPRWVGVALSLPPDDERRIHFKSELEALLHRIENDGETCRSALLALDADEMKWKRP
jgi:hypothetical protein